ncbi:efflux RND transporter periplasmic adaptor subunit [Geobacter pelophilus]|uniref:Efflux RND transporter periplasmic adaptor subunit n=1 Tax=Geoanaerobacter pelophilus TaxID=60036 RepID=A0AAW4L083_9BACT|nr:efflux RND transporter periplasmic adaptor subunit [Geoanaerobacter pelophilus]
MSANELDELETEQKKAEHQFEEAQERLKTKTILSTIDGVVAERMLAPGDYVGEAPILKLARLDPLKVEVIVPVRRFGAIKTGMKAEVRPEQPVGGVYIGKVTIVDKVIDAAQYLYRAGGHCQPVTQDTVRPAMPGKVSEIIRSRAVGHRGDYGAGAVPSFPALLSQFPILPWSAPLHSEQPAGRP